MSIHGAGVAWSLNPDEDFASGRYSRGHSLTFDGGHAAPGTASADVVGARWAQAGAVDPEALLVGALSACHMLSFLHVARLAGFVVTGYADQAQGVLEENAQGRLAITRATLRPQIVYAGREPTPDESGQLHHAAHEACFIANSVKTTVSVEAPV